MTTTPSREPIVLDAWVENGVHINAIGADAPGKQEHDPVLLKRAPIFLDDMAQGMEAGEVNFALSQGLLMADDIDGELADVVVGEVVGRMSDIDITLFSSTGLAIQDVALGIVLLQKLNL